MLLSMLNAQCSMLNAQWISLRRDRLALFLVFVLPIIFFSVFAMIFGGGSGTGSKPVSLKVVFLDLDKTKSSISILNAIQNLEAIDAVFPVTDEGGGQLNEEEILRMVLTNKADAAIVVPAGLEQSIASFGGDRPAVKVIYDSANPMAEGMLSGVLQGAAVAAAPDVLIEKGLEQFRVLGGPFSDQQNAAMKLMAAFLAPGAAAVGSSQTDEKLSDESQQIIPKRSSSLSMNDGLIKIETVSAQQAGDERSKKRVGSIIAYYAAGVAVMFLMFSMAGSASALLEHQENGTLERLISGQMSITQLILSHWTFFVLTGIVQLIVMFSFAALVFNVDFSRPAVLCGCGVMTVVTSMASASFIIMLATFCRSRKQLESISTTVILIVSAFGGSMVPRPFLPEFIRDTSKLTFNGWALDGFLKVLWYYDPGQNIFVSLQWHIAVILMMAGGFLMVATWRAQRWGVA